MSFTDKELLNRLERFKIIMSEIDPNWELVVLMDKINIYYFTGTIQNGALAIPRVGDAIFYVRRSFERAKDESSFAHIVPFKSFKELKLGSGSVLHCDTERITLAHFSRFEKYFNFSSVRSADLALSKTMAVKSLAEIKIMEECGELHRSIMEEFIPTVLKEGMSEVELGAAVLNEMLKRGHHAVTRTASFGSELYVGVFCFGESALYYNNFDGPVGLRGLSPAVPLFGNADVKLKKNMPVIVDMGFNREGYHTDKTSVYSIGKLSDEALEFHKTCVDMQNKAASMLKPGASPEDIFNAHLEGVSAEFLQEYNGYGAGKVSFLGHGIGLFIDQYPVIAKGVTAPLQNNMVIALEPKRGIKGLGMVGVENTYVVTPDGGRSITGQKFDVIEV